MTNRTFAEYKQDMRNYVIQYAKERQGTQEQGCKTTSEMNIGQIAEGLRNTFPKEPILGDRVAVCYAYTYLSALPMEQQYYQDWRKQIKAFINEAPAETQGNDANLCFMLRGLSLSQGSPAETFRYAEKALKKMTRQTRHNPKVVAFVGQMVRPHYEQVVEHACNANNFSGYMQQVRAFDKAIDVMLYLPSGSRYREAQKLMEKMAPVYRQSEWGREEWGRKCSSIRRRVYRSLPVEAKQAIRSRRAQDEWLYK